MSRREPPTASETISVRWRYHMGLPGAVYVFVTLLVALGAFNSQNNLLFWAFGFALALLIISGFLSRTMLMGVEVVRDPVAAVVEGESGVVHYRVRNRNRFVPAFALTLAEVSPASLPRLGRRTRRRSGRSDEGVLSSLAFVAHVAPGRSAAAPGYIVAKRRGPAPLEAILVSTSFPFGLIKKSLLFDQPGEIMVRPRLLQLPHGFVNSAVRTGDRGQAPTRRPGAGDEFFSLREYQPGDAMRDIAWRASARRDELLVRQTASPAPMRMHVVLSFDASPGAEADEQAIRLAASVADAALARNLAVGLRVLHTQIEIRPRDGRLQRELIMDALAKVSPDAARAAPRPDADHLNAEARQLRSPGVLVMVHAGPADRAAAPAWAVHLSADEFPPLPPSPPTPPPPPSTPAPPPSPPARSRVPATA